jgi:outer membrane protein OmpA-like peptidoglycan-associated protein
MADPRPNLEGESMTVAKLIAAFTISVALHAQNPFTDHLNQGKALVSQQKWADARKEFHAALSEATPGLQSASAAFRIAQTYRGEGNTDAALDWYKQSLQYSQSKQAEDEMMQLELARTAKPVNAADIKNALSLPPSDRSPVAEANSIDLDILFGFNDAKLTPEGLKQVHELALAVGSDEFKGKSFQITGHTDSVGADEYNLKLSLERATSVRDALLKETHVPLSSLKCEGKGKREPKYRTDSEEARRLNRRVQVTLLD